MEIINWSEVERLCRLSFTGAYITDDERAILQDAHARSPEEYRARTNAVRDEERAKLRAL